MSEALPPRIIRFGDFEADLPAGQLRKRGIRLPLRGQALDVLAALLERPGEVVTREELRHRLWPHHVFVDFDNSLNTAVARLREALSDSASHPRFIETLPRRGYRFLASPSEVSSSKYRLLVLPFDNFSADPGQEYFSNAVTDEMINTLARLAPAELAVLARTTAMHYKRREKNVLLIGRELNVDYVVEGSVSREDSRFSMIVHLIRVGDQTHLWTNRYDAELGDLFEAENSAAQEIARRLGIAPPPAARKPTEDVEAYSLWVQGRYYFGKATPEGFARAQRCFKEAAERDPEFALPHESLAEVYYYLGFMGFLPPKDALSAGLFCALRAIEIDNTLAETHALLGHFRKQLDYNWAEATRELKLALELNPSSPLVRLRYAMNGLLPHGLMKEAIAKTDQALEFDPMSSVTRTWLGAMCWLDRQFDRGIEETRRVLEIDPAYYMAYFIMGQNYAGKGMYEEALAVHQKAIELSGGAPLMFGWQGIPLGKLGRAGEARSIFERLCSIAQTSYVPPTAFAWLHLGLGEIDSFFEQMDRAVDARDHMLTGVKSYWFLDEIRCDPRYAALLGRMNLAP